MDDTYLIWSNEHRAWWRPKAQGYTNDHQRAGRYTRDEALQRSRVRDQRPGEPFPELPIREMDLSDILVTPSSPPSPGLEGSSASTGTNRGSA